MSESPRQLIARLQAAQLVVSVAMEPGAGIDIKRSAVRSMIRALDKLAKDDALQEQLYAAYAMPEQPRLAEDIVQCVADMLTEQYAVILLSAGYRTPPPPPAHELIERTRRAVLEPPTYSYMYGSGHIEAVFGELREYVDELRKHVADTKLKQVKKSLLEKSRPLLGGLMLLAVANHVEVTLGGEQFDYSVRFSKEDLVKVEVTIPTNLPEAALRQAIVDASLGTVSSEIGIAMLELRPIQMLEATPKAISSDRDATMEDARAAAAKASAAVEEMKKRHRRQEEEEHRRRQYYSSRHDDDSSGDSMGL